VEYIDNAEQTVGYKVGTLTREAFTVVGYTLIIEPGEDDEIPAFWDELLDDGRLEQLRGACGDEAWALGLGSWDPECPKAGQRYTICTEEVPGADLSVLEMGAPLYRKEIGASEWLYFEIPRARDIGAFWDADPYQMMKKLGYQLNMSGYDVGLHFDAYPPGPLDEDGPMEFRITVVAADNQ